MRYLFLAAFLFTKLSYSDDTWKNWGSIRTTSFQKDLDILKNLDIDITGVSHDKTQIDFLISNEEFKTLSQNGLDIKLRDIKGIFKGPDERYKNPEEIEILLKEFHQNYPAITKLESIGKSLEGRDIWALKISDNPNLKEINEPVFLVNSMHHAREVMTPEVAIDMIEYLLTNYFSDSKVRSWVNKSEIWVIPMFNVDGNHKMWDGNKWWRKNTRGGYGVDLNRNYPSFWGSCNGSSGFKRSQTYRGPSAASEPETNAMMNFIANIRPAINISYHSYSELVIYPYGCKGNRTLNYKVVEGLGKEIANKLNYKPGTSWETLYNTDGGDIDWMHDQYQVIPFVIEVNKSAQGFHPNYDKWRDKTVELNRKGWMHALNRLHSSGLIAELSINEAKIFDYQVEVFFKGHKVSDYLSQKNGVIHLVLEQGEYELFFKKDDKILGKYNIILGNKLKRANIEL